MDTTLSPRFVVATHVRAGRDSDFERFLHDVVVPAEVQARPHQVGMWRLLRPAADQPEGATRAWLMIFSGRSNPDLASRIDARVARVSVRSEMSSFSQRSSSLWQRAIPNSTRAPSSGTRLSSTKRDTSA